MSKLQGHKKKLETSKSDRTEKCPPDDAKTVVSSIKTDNYSPNWMQLKKILEEEKLNKKQDVSTKGGMQGNRTRKWRRREIQTKDYSKSGEQSATVKNPVHIPGIGKKRKLNPLLNKGDKKLCKMQISSDPDVWFDDVDPVLLSTCEMVSQASSAEPKGDEVAFGTPHLTRPMKSLPSQGLGKIVAMGCMILGEGIEGSYPILARISIANQFGKVIYDKYIKPKEKVPDYYTAVMGIQQADLQNGSDLYTVQEEVGSIIKGCLVVGHKLKHQFKHLFLSHPKRMMRDTARCKVFQNMFGKKASSLEFLAAKIMGLKSDQGKFDSVDEAQAVMHIYVMNRKLWENSLRKQASGEKLNTKMTKCD